MVKGQRPEVKLNYKQQAIAGGFSNFLFTKNNLKCKVALQITLIAYLIFEPDSLLDHLPKIRAGVSHSS